MRPAGAPAHLPEARAPAAARRGLWFAAGAIGLWCFTGLCFAAGSRALGPMVYTTLVSLVGVAVGAALHRARQRPLAGLVSMPPRVWAAGFLGIAVYTVLLVLAVGVATERDLAQVALVNYLWPVLMVLFACLLLPDRPPLGRALLGAALGLAGVAAVRGVDTFARPPADLLPHAMALAGACLWALYSVLLRRWRVPEEHNGSTAQFALCAALAATVGMARGEWAAAPHLTPAAVFWVLFCGVGPVGLGYYWWEIGVKQAPPHLAATLSFSIPVVSAVLIGLAYRQALSPGLLPGAALITLGAVVARGARTPA
ncbi:MAG: EamA family transporter [Chthonomonadales bacterium]|nr:EamA family transporter [Chthonomonadales bacterium]